jgi:hypothetical protein
LRCDHLRELRGKKSLSRLEKVDAKRLSELLDANSLTALRDYLLPEPSEDLLNSLKRG